METSWSRLRVRHVVPRWPSDDAIAAIDDALPGTATWVALTGKADIEEARVVSLNAGALTPIGTLRTRYRMAIRTLGSADLTIYHGPWGTDLFGSADGRCKRVFWQHEPGFVTRAGLDRLARDVDAMWFDRESWRVAVHASHGWIPERRLLHMPLVFSEDQFAPPSSGNRRSPAVLGWVGSLNVTPDRADRLPLMLDALEAEGFAGRVEICGDGPWRRKLRRKLSADKVMFFPLDEWKERIASWDGLLCLANDARWTLPVVRAMKSGKSLLLPVDEYGDDLPTELTYPAGDLLALAAHWSPSAAPGREQAVRAAWNLVRRETEVVELSKVKTALTAVQSLPMAATRGRGMGGIWPFAIYRRLHRLLQGTG